MPRPRASRALAMLAMLASLAAFGCAEGDHLVPSTPGGLTAAPGNQAVTLSWKVDEKVRYSLYWSTRSPVDLSSTPIEGVESPYLHLGLENDLRIYYRLVASNEHGESPLSPEVTATPRAKATSPGAPSSMAAVAGDQRVTISWKAVPGATRYTIYRDTSTGVRASLSTSVGEASSPFVDGGLQNGVTYYYAVAAWRDGKQGPLSAEVEATPEAGGSSTLAAPQNVAAVGSDGSVSLSWGSVAGADRYTIYWGPASGVTPQSGTALANAQSPYEHASLQNGQPYYYVVTAWRGSEESAPSVEVSATPSGSAPVVPLPPSNVAAAAGDGKVTVTWSSVSGASSYTLYWGTSAGVTPTTGTKVSAATSPYVHSPAQNGVTYYYVVTASDANGESAASKEVSATPSSTPTNYGSISSTLSAGAYAVVLLENLQNGQGIVQLQVYTSDPQGSPAGSGVSGLTVLAQNAISGSLPATATAGVYSNTTPAHLVAGTYVFQVSGARSGTVTAKVNALPSCVVTAPGSGSSHTAGTDLPVKWTSKNSQKATILLQDSKGQVSYPPLVPDPLGALVPGSDIPYVGALQVLVSAAWSMKAANAGLVVLGDGGTQIMLQ